MRNMIHYLQITWMCLYQVILFVSFYIKSFRQCHYYISLVVDNYFVKKDNYKTFNVIFGLKGVPYIIAPLFGKKLK